MRGDATTALLRAIRKSLPPSAAFTTETIRSRNWASGTFAGTRHEIGFRLEGECAAAAAEEFLDGLEDREFDVRGHILADIRLVGREDLAAADGARQVRISLEALTVEAD